MPSGKASKKTPKVKKWVPKKGWVIKQVKNPVIYQAMPSYPPLSCPKCLFSPCYADAYGTYHCPRCGDAFNASTHTMELYSAPIGSGSRTCPYCRYSPCWPNILTGSYKCPHCGKSF
jgi:DNA-directed RNA polymerase subunit RPC12/RpoP